jgi:hypothetical protein
MNPEPSLSAKWLELLKEIAPATSRVMVMLNADNVANLSRLRVIEASAPLFGLRVALAQVVSPTWLAHSTHAYIVMHFPCIASGIQHEQVECIVADEFIGRFIIDLHPFYLVLIALVAKVLFWIAREIRRRRYFDGPMLRLSP